MQRPSVRAVGSFIVIGLNVWAALAQVAPNQFQIGDLPRLAPVRESLFWLMLPITAGWILWLLHSMDRRLNAIQGQHDVTLDNVEQHIRAWSDKFGLAVQRDERMEDQSYFALIVTGKDSIKRGVARLKKLDRYVIVFCNLVLAETHKATYDTLSEAQKTEIDEIVALDLSRSGFRFEIQPQLKKVSIEKELPITEALSEESFINALDDVGRAWKIARIQIVQALRRMKPQANIPPADV
jgi:hypothetical protein